MQLHPTSALYGLGHLPDYVVYHELVYTKSTFMSSVTAVEPQWLAEIGDVFYSIRSRDGGAPRKTDQALRRKEQIEDGFAQSVMNKRKGEEAAEEQRRRRQEAQAVATPGATPVRRGRRVGL